MCKNCSYEHLHGTPCPKEAGKQFVFHLPDEQPSPLERTTSAPRGPPEFGPHWPLSRNAMPVTVIQLDGSETTGYVPIVCALKQGLITVVDAISRGYTTEDYVAQLQRNGWVFE